MKSRLPVHRHANGHWCHCSFGNKDPYVSPQEREVYGHKESVWHEASKLEWLRARPDLQHPHHQRFLDRLELAYPDHDALYPWLVREQKKGRIADPWEEAVNLRYPQRHDLYGESNHLWNTPLTFQNSEGYHGQLSPDALDQVNDWMKYKKQAGKGIDIMQHHIGDAVDEARKSDIGGEVVHELPNGYKILKLRNKRDMTREGDRMNHCIGGGYGYIEKNDAGDGLYYSLRDEDNEPWGTIEVEKDHDEYYKCPGCKKFVFGEHQYNPEGYANLVCENCDHTLKDAGKLADGVQEHPLTLKGKTHPDSKYTSVAQMFGRNDDKLHEHHESMFNQYLGQHGHSYYESDGNEPEEEEFEPWWDSYYTADGPRTVSDYMDYRHDLSSYYEENTHDDYQRAVRDAYEHDHEPPDIEVESPDWEDIWDDAMNHANPEDFNRLWQTAVNEGDHEELREQAENWLENYQPNIDPYGTVDSQGLHRGVVPPSTPGGNWGDAAFNEPGGHFPGNDQEQQELYHNYLNTMYQLDKHFPVDPQTGERMDKYDQRNRYPQDSPAQRRYAPNPTSPTPEIPNRVQTPLTEQTGPAITPRLPEDEGRYIPPSDRNVELPYGRGERTIDPGNVVNMDWPNYQVPMGLVPERARHRPNYPQESRPEPTPPFVPSGPGNTPEEFFGPGNETTLQHQRAFPGMEWRDMGRRRVPDSWEEDRDESPYAKPRTPYNPNEPHMFGQGEQQGQLFPGGWYIDKAKQRAQQTELPEYLFHSDRFGYHNENPGYRDQGYSGTHPGQTTPMWEQSDHPYWSVINTQNELPSQESPMPYPIGPNRYSDPIPPQHVRPAGPFIASTKESGKWTEVEEKGGKDRPKEDKNEGYGIFDVDVHHGHPHLNGRVIEHTGSGFHKMPGFEWRRPVVYDKNEDRMYVGQPSMEHSDMMKTFHKPNPWGANHDAKGDYIPGFIDIGDTVGGGLHFFNDAEVPNVDELHDWVEDEYGTRAAEAPPSLANIDWDDHESRYHPRQNDEWAADDEPVFSAVIPEGRWSR